MELLKTSGPCAAPFAPLARFARWVAPCALLLAVLPGGAHVVLEDQAALAGSSYKAVLRVGHGCDGAPTSAIRVRLPAGFQGAKPMPKPGWQLSTRSEKLAQPYTSHGKTVSEDVVEITWTATSRDHWLPDAWYDEFVLRGTLPASAGPLWFKVLQSCEPGRIDWAEVPAQGTSTKGIKAPAALLEVIPSGRAGHAH